MFMARSLRVEYPGAVYHVLNRGNYQKAVFESPETRVAFETCLFGACRRYGWRLYAYCTLSNHYHCALETPEPNLSVGMHNFHSPLEFACLDEMKNAAKVLVELVQLWAKEK